MGGIGLVTIKVMISTIITYRAKLLNPDWLNHEGTFGNQEGMIT